MKALDVYRATLTEMDKFESPSATVNDFNYFFMVAVHEFTDVKQHLGTDSTQRDHDDIKDLLSDPTELIFGGVVSTLPESYRNMLGLKLVLKFTQNKGKHSKDDLITVYPKKKRSSRDGYISDNSYQQPKLKRSWYTLNKNSITFDIDPATILDKVTMEFYEKPKVVYLNPGYPGLSDEAKALEENNTTLQFPDHTVAKIVKVCRRIMLENIESGRYNTVLNENNLTVK